MTTFVDNQVNEHTKQAYALDIAKWETFLAGREPNEQVAMEFRAFLTETLSNASALRVFSTIRSMYRWNGGENPFEKVKAPTRTKNWTPVVPADSDIDRLLEVCKNPVDRGMMSVLANGLRAQEVCDLNVEDFYLDESYSAWFLRVTGKGGVMRIVPVNDEAATAIIDILPTRGRIFKNMTPRKLHYLVRDKYGKAAGIDIHPHALRHNYATRLIRAGADVFSVQRLLGHSRTETTSVYVNLDLGDLVRTNSLDP